MDQLMDRLPRRYSRGIPLALLLAAAVAAATPLHAQNVGSTPSASGIAPLNLPPIELRKLSNGIDVAVMHDTGQIVSVGAALDLGPAADPADKPGLGDFVRAMLNLGTTQHTAETIADSASKFRSRATATFLYAPIAYLDRVLPLMADQLLHPAFSEEALGQLKTNATAALQRANRDPRLLAPDIFKTILYGADHPYARPQTDATITSITRDDLVAYYTKHIGPPNVHFAVVGNISPDSAVAKLERQFGSWKAATATRPSVPAPKSPDKTTIYLYDVPGTAQSNIWLGNVGLRRDSPDYAAVSVMNTVVGGSPTSRLANSLWRQHRYTPIAQSGFSFQPVPEPGAFAAYSAMPTAKADSVLVEMVRELRDVRGARPITADEFQAAHAQMSRQLPLELSQAPQRMAAIVDILGNKLPLDYYQTVATKLSTMKLADVQAAANAYITPDRFAIVVVGDRATLEPRLRATNLGPVVVVDQSGAPKSTP